VVVVDGTNKVKLFKDGMVETEVRVDGVKKIKTMNNHIVMLTLHHVTIGQFTENLIFEKKLACPATDMLVDFAIEQNFIFTVNESQELTVFEVNVKERKCDLKARATLHGTGEIKSLGFAGSVLFGAF